MSRTWTWMLGLGAMLSCVVACSGGITGVGNGGDGGKDGGGGPGDPFDAGPGPGCKTSQTSLQRACVPGTAKANASITVEVDGDGCLGCATTLLPCKVDVAGNVISITLEQSMCPLPEGTECAAVCGLPTAKCTIPPLAAGDYTVQLTGTARTGEDPTRRLVVTESATSTSCDIPDDRKAPPPIVATSYAQSCAGDEDCVLITEGDVCQLCTCPNAAISKSAEASYQSDLRARQSLCTSGGGAACAPCETKKAHCGDGGKCVAVGP